MTYVWIDMREHGHLFFSQMCTPPLLQTAPIYPPSITHCIQPKHEQASAAVELFIRNRGAMAEAALRLLEAGG